MFFKVYQLESYMLMSNRKIELKNTCLEQACIFCSSVNSRKSNSNIQLHIIYIYTHMYPCTYVLYTHMYLYIHVMCAHTCMPTCTLYVAARTDQFEDKLYFKGKFYEIIEFF